MNLTKDDINISLREFDGVWIVYYLIKNEKIIYVGSSKNIYKRLKQHKYQKSIDEIKLRFFDNEVEAKTFERIEIFSIRPELNKYCKNGFRNPEMKNQKIDFKSKRNVILSLINR